MIKVLMVCLGNICRSPLAQGILESKVNPTKVFVDSAGTGGYHIGNKPDKRSIAVAIKNGLNISHQRCRKFNTDDFNDFDHIYVMDNSNYENIISLAENDAEKSKVKLLLEITPQGVQEVPDPYYGGEDGFDYVYKLINEACDLIAVQIKF